MGVFLWFGVVMLLGYVPAVAIVTLGLLALWNAWRPPRLWQVVLATTVVGFVPWLVFNLNDLVRDWSAPDLAYRTWLAVVSSFSLYLPVLVPAVLWSLQRHGVDASSSRRARIFGNLLVAYLVLVAAILPATFFGFLVFSE